MHTHVEKPHTHTLKINSVVHIRIQWIMETLGINTQKPLSMHCRLSRATVLQLAVREESHSNFPREKSNAEVVKKSSDRLGCVNILSLFLTTTTNSPLLFLSVCLSS